MDAPDQLTEADFDEILSTPLSEQAGCGPGMMVESSPGSRLVVPKKGKVFDENGVCEVVVIRPCVSRGKRIRGLPPIYTPHMLESNAPVYSGWLMYMNHLTEAIVEALMQEGRKIQELGGRVLESRWDSEVRYKDDADFGFQPGGVVARVLPQPKVREMLESDPEILNVSHNAWPTGARKSKAPWDATQEGYLIEGIRKSPEGSVDWVPRGGAGGRVRLQEWETFAVQVLGSGYSAPRRESEDKKNMDLTKINTREALIEAVRSENPALAEALKLDDAPAAGHAPAVLTQEALQEALTEQAETFKTKLEEAQTSLEERAQERATELLQSERAAGQLATKAKKLIESAGLPSRWQADLLRRYSILPSGPSAALQALLEQADPDAALEESVTEDANHARQLIEEVGGTPSVSGLGGTTHASTARDKRRSSGVFRDFMRESEERYGAKTEEKAKNDDLDGTIKEMVSEGVR